MMPFSRQISLTRALTLGQWDKIVLMLTATCCLPLFLHALPFSWAETLGPRWLPIFYAPLIAGLCFRPHVTIVVSLLAPLINHFFFGMPTAQVLPVLTWELVLFNAILVVVKARMQVKSWQVVPAFLAAVFSALLFPAHLTMQQVLGQFALSIRMSAPGILVLVLITEVINHLQKRWGHEEDSL